MSHHVYPDTTSPDGNWRDHAACAREEDREIFFPKGNSGPCLIIIAEAKAVCRRCPVAEYCLRSALETDEAFGIWGGLTEQERRKLKRRSRRNTALLDEDDEVAV
ncbi:WhiB family transcriptional regulator [Streptomyces sp. NPDC007148]|uniref:WhiB family transcriptional regulator n=1 Tax=Streptomyces sp. NPDC007148 TaxID=3364775 RepID=UPI003683B898